MIQLHGEKTSELGWWGKWLLLSSSSRPLPLESLYKLVDDTKDPDYFWEVELGRQDDVVGEGSPCRSTLDPLRHGEVRHVPLSQYVR